MLLPTWAVERKFKVLGSARAWVTQQIRVGNDLAAVLAKTLSLQEDIYVYPLNTELFWKA